MGLKLKVYVVVDTKYMSSPLYTQKQSIDCITQSSMVCIRYVFYSGPLDEIFRQPGKFDLIDVLTIAHRSLTDVSNLTLFSGRLRYDYNEAAVIETSK